MDGIKIHNIKVSAKVPDTDLIRVEEELVERNIKHKRHNNFLVINKTYTYTLFKRCRQKLRLQHCNITKCKFETINDAVLELTDIISCTKHDIKIIDVDNITATFNLNHHVDLNTFLIINDHISNLTDYNAEVFPGVWITTPFGKTSLFRSGTLVMVGARSLKQVTSMKMWVMQKCVFTKIH